MEKFDTIFNLLEKESLSDEEIKFLENEVKSDKEIKKLVKIFKSLQNKPTDSPHINIETLSSYVMFENGEEPEEQIESVLANKIKEHLEKCSYCRIEYENIKTEYINTGEFVDSVFSGKDEKEKARLPMYSNNKSGFASRYAFLTAAALCLIYFGLFVFSNLNLQSYKKNLFNQGTEEVYSTRGRATLNFQKGLDAVEHGEYEVAEKYFKDDIEENKNDKSIFYTYYILGITQLHTSEKSFLGLFTNYDRKIVDDAIVSFKRAIELNTTGNYKNINLDAHYYLGRAFLLEDDIKNAEQNLNLVIEKKGRFYNEAKELIETLIDS